MLKPQNGLMKNNNKYNKNDKISLPFIKYLAILNQRQLIIMLKIYRINNFYNKIEFIKIAI